MTAAFAGLGLATACWASAFILGKGALGVMTPLGVGAWRYAFASALLLPFALRSAVRHSRSVAKVPGSPATTLAAAPLSEVLRAVAAPLLVMIVAGGVLYPWLFLDALRRTSATNTSLLIALNPVMTVMLAPLVGEKLIPRQLAGAFIAFAGAIVVISRGDLGKLAALDLDTGDVLAVVAAACWAGFNLASRPVVAVLAPSIANLAVYLGGFVALFALAESPLDQLANAPSSTIWAIALMALLSSVVAGQLFLIGVRVAGVGRAVVFVYLVPVLTAALSIALLGESFELAQGAGGIVVLAGVWLATTTGASATAPVEIREPPVAPPGRHASDTA